MKELELQYKEKLMKLSNKEKQIQDKIDKRRA